VKSDLFSERLLADLVREAQNDPVPELDWERMERRLSSRIESERDLRRSSTVRKALPFIAAAAAVVFAISLFEPDPQRAVPAVVPPERATATATKDSHDSAHTIDGSTLRTGQRVSAGEHPVTVAHAARLTWTLEPESAAVVSHTEPGLTLRLEKGTVEARVTASRTPESFAVEVGETRVAVQGTVFRVERRDGHVHVRVREGTVVVGRAGAPGRTNGWQLEAPARGRFSLDGLRGNVWPDEPQAPSADAVAAPALPAAKTNKPATRATSAEQARASKTRAKEPSLAEVEKSLNRVTALANRCLADNTAVGGGVRVSVRTMGVLRVAPDGSVTSISFAPPLAPDVEQCVRQGLVAVRFAASDQGVTLTRQFDLKR
jgi:ferric-dicitrate binding protein FerR (iron transport regulator)